MPGMLNIESSWIGRFQHKRNPAYVLTILGHLEH